MTVNRTNTQATSNVHRTVTALRTALEREFTRMQERTPRLFRLALNEAEALAWETEFPHLVFPTLATEKLQTLCAWHRRQATIKQIDTALAFAE